MCNANDITDDLSSIIVQPTMLTSPGNNYGAHQIGDKKRTFLAHIFYLPASPQNDKHRAALPDGAVVHVHSFLPPDTVDAVMQSNTARTITLDEVKVTFTNNGLPQIIDTRDAADIPGTDAYKNRFRTMNITPPTIP
ncbi:hypothetical protein [Micavibrio aeruginosavorus]|uniref:Uncharacterized protein n=1 Tax=Micavibrio aeruginosavorus EPB TaxID=349215 RepID=M4VGR4_9BACT|nr:hypothetical protein [Micavibrio aeruginosavorus]AGH97246.1 hypothetical protein A11S_413 [Micavibrio aeruginosavorus EPB]